MTVVMSKALTAAGDLGCSVKQWPDLALGDSGAPIKTENFANCSIQVEGEFGEKGAVHILGTLDGQNYHQLRDKHGSYLSFDAPDLRSLDPAVQALKPEVPAGDEYTKVTVTVLMRK